MPYPGSRVQKHPNDCSVMTYRGHKVLKTLIRCGFSPAESTGQRYVYSGSEDGKAHVSPMFRTSISDAIDLGP